MCSVLWSSIVIYYSLFVASLFKFYGIPESDEDATDIAEVNTSKKFDSEVWFEDLGFFEIGEPWTTLLRPVPPPMGPEENPAIVYLYSWRNTTKPYSITLFPEININGAPFDGRRPTAIIIHGYKVNTTYEWIRNLKDAYLNSVGGNVLLTDWGMGSSCEILQAASNTRVIAKLMVRLIRHLILTRALRPRSIHLIGHSLGAHICSYIAKEIPGIPRLTALDPAQPAFEGYPKKVRLDKSDAGFVEVVHTNAKPFVPHLGFGMVRPHGHVDFYFNDGSDQPGCTLPNEIPKIHSLRDAVMFPLNYDLNIFTCSHSRAHDYLIEAYNNTNGCTFWGHRARERKGVSARESKLGMNFNLSAPPEPCSKVDCIPFGLETINSPLRGVFVVTTNSQRPFCVFESGSLR